jgi:hypothetical protein
VSGSTETEWAVRYERGGNHDGCELGKCAGHLSTFTPRQEVAERFREEMRRDPIRYSRHRIVTRQVTATPWREIPDPLQDGIAAFIQERDRKRARNR